MNTLKTNHFDYKAGTQVKVLAFMGSGRVRVQFPDGVTDIIGKSKLAK